MSAEQVATRRSRTRIASWWRAWIALPLVAAFLARVLGPFDIVLGGSQIVLLGNDPYFHLRQVRFAAEHFPRLQRFDVQTNYPFGEANHTSGLFDWIVGLLARLARAVGFASGFEPEATLLAVAPPVLALLCLLGMFTLLRRVHGERAAWLGLGLSVLFPGEFLEKSCLGFGDHHVAEVVLVVGALLAWSRSDGAVSSGRRAVVSAFAATLPLGLLALTWSGAAVYLAAWVVAAAISVVWAHGPERPLAAADAWRSSARGAALLSMLGVSLWLLPGLVPWRDTFVLALLGASALGLVGPIWTVLWRWQSRSRLRTALALGLLSFAGWYALSLAFPQWAGRLFAAKNELVSEQRAVTLGLLWRDLGPIPFLAPVALVIALGRRSGSDCERALVFTVTFAAIVGVLWIATHDYGYLASVLLTLNAAVTLAELTAADFPLWRRARRALETALGPRRGVAALGVAVFSLGALCLFTCTPPFLTRADASAMLIARPPWLDVARWISQRTPTPPSLLASAAPTTGDFQYPRGAYGVLSWWDFGNLISAEARRPVVASQRLSERVADFLLSDEKQGLDILKEGCRGDERVRYVIVDAQTLTEKFASIVGIARRSMDGFTEVSADGLPRYSARYEETLGVRLLERGGSTLGHFRLVHDTRDVAHTFYEGYVSADGAKLFDRRSVPAGPSTAPLDFDVALERAGVEPARPPYDRRLVPEIRVFEVVPGARLVGRAPPRARVHAIVTLEGDGVPRRAVGYSATAGPSGDFSVHVAHANGVTLSDTVRTAASYLLYLQQDEQQRLWSRPVVAEADVVDGRAVIVPAP